jgi:hypothetical protein
MKGHLMMTTPTPTRDDRMRSYLDALNGSAPEGYSFDVTQGRRYTKVVMTARGGQRSVHSFVDGEGNVYKPAGWSRPAEHVRFRLLDEASWAALRLVACGDKAFTGGYLYL